VSQGVTGHLTVHVECKSFFPVFHIMKRGIIEQTLVKTPASDSIQVYSVVFVKEIKTEVAIIVIAFENS